MLATNNVVYNNWRIPSGSLHWSHNSKRAILPAVLDIRHEVGARAGPRWFGPVITPKSFVVVWDDNHVALKTRSQTTVSRTRTQVNPSPFPPQLICYWASSLKHSHSSSLASRANKHRSFTRPVLVGQVHVYTQASNTRMQMRSPGCTSNGLDWNGRESTPVPCQPMHGTGYASSNTQQRLHHTWCPSVSIEYLASNCYLPIAHRRLFRSADECSFSQSATYGKTRSDQTTLWSVF